MREKRNRAAAAIWMVLAAVTISAAPAPDAGRHLAMVRSQPEKGATVEAMPELLQLWFNQALEPAISRVGLSGPAGDVELGKTETGGEDGKSMMASVPAGLADGTYEVSWRAAGDDGHPVRGTFTFTLASEQ